MGLVRSGNSYSCKRADKKTSKGCQQKSIEYKNVGKKIKAKLKEGWLGEECEEIERLETNTALMHMKIIKIAILGMNSRHEGGGQRNE